jgi:hypothetical protein
MVEHHNPAVTARSFEESRAESSAQICRSVRAVCAGSIMVQMGMIAGRWRLRSAAPTLLERPVNRGLRFRGVF